MSDVDFTAAAAVATDRPPRRRLRPLWLELAFLVALGILPVALATAALLAMEAASERAYLGRSLQATAEALSHAVDGEVKSYRTLLETLAKSPALVEGNIERFHSFAKIASEDKGAFIGLFLADGTQVMNTSRPVGSAMPQPFESHQPAVDGSPPLSDPGVISRAVLTGSPVNSNLFKSLATGRLVFSVVVPVMRDGATHAVLTVAISPDVLSPLVVRSSGETGNVRTGVIDANGFVLARWRDGEGVVGTRASAGYLEHRQRSGKFLATFASRDGPELLVAAHTSEKTGWTSVAHADLDSRFASTSDAWAAGASIALLGLVFGTGLAFLMSKRLTSSMQALVTVAATGRQTDGEARPRLREFAAIQSSLMRVRSVEHQATVEREQRLVAQARQADLERAAKEKDSFIATLSHELRNPLAAISNAVALIRRGRSDGPVVDRLERQVAHLTRLVDDTLDVARMMNGKIQLVRSTIDLRLVVDAAIETVSQRFEKKHQALSYRQPDEPAMVDGDPVRLVQVVTNLLDNASKYSPEHGTVKVDLQMQGACVALRVIDAGRGISTQDLSRVFEPFAQVQGPDPVMMTDGLGLGLALSKQIVASHGGAIRIQSEGLGRGCVVTVELPRSS